MADTDDPFSLGEPLPNGPDEEANQKAVQTFLQNYTKALEEEFSDGVAYEEGKLTPVEIKTRTKELLTQAVPKAVASALHLCQHAKNEQVRLSASKYIIDKAVGKEVGGLVGNPMEELLERINASAE
jgi:hypothetical protein